MRASDPNSADSMISGSKGKTTAAFVILTIALGWWAWWASQAWDSPGLVGHEFRQAQTIQAMQQDGFRIDYATPILGKPWAIPMEFPLYQFAAVKFGELFGTEIAVSGRWVSALCFVIGILALVLLLREIGFSWGASALGVVPVVTAPVYFFYSRTVMIESMAWAAAAWFLVGVFRFRRSGARGAIALALGAGMVAVLVKATTWAAFCLPWAIVFLADTIQVLRKKHSGWRNLVIQAAGIGVPLLLLGFAWVKQADAIKSENPLADFLLSSALTEFNFGTVALRLMTASWSQLSTHWHDSLGPLWLLAGGALVALASRRTRLVLALGTVAFLGAQLIFFGLYLFHDYYFYANGAFACLILGSLAAASWDASNWRKLGPVLAILGVIGGAAVQFPIYHGKHFVDQTHPPGDGAAIFRAIQAITSTDEVVVVQSPDWSSTPAYFSKRRMLTIPDAQMFMHPDKVERSLALLADESVPLVLFMRESRIHPEWVIDRIDDLHLWPRPVFTTDTAVTAYARADRYESIRHTLLDLNLPGLTVASPEPLVAPELRKDLLNSAEGAALQQLGLFPFSTYLPYGVEVYNRGTGPALSMHGTSELYFAIPAGTTRVSFEHGINRPILNFKDFDGLGVQLELVNNDGESTVIHQEWISPHTTVTEWKSSAAIPPTDAKVMLYRITTGPRDNAAYDQSWLRSLHFE